MGKYELAWNHYFKAKSLEKRKKYKLTLIKSSSILKDQIKELFPQELISLIQQSKKSQQSKNIYITTLTPSLIPSYLFEKSNQNNVYNLIQLNYSNYEHDHLYQELHTLLKTYDLKRNQKKLLKEIESLQNNYQKLLKSQNYNYNNNKDDKDNNNNKDDKLNQIQIIYPINYQDIGYISLLDPNSIFINIITDPFDTMIQYYQGSYSIPYILHNRAGMNMKLIPKVYLNSTQIKNFNSLYQILVEEYINYLTIISYWNKSIKQKQQENNQLFYDISIKDLIENSSTFQNIILLHSKSSFKSTKSTPSKKSTKKSLQLYQKEFIERITNYSTGYYWNKYQKPYESIKKIYLKQLNEEIQKNNIELPIKDKINWYFTELFYNYNNNNNQNQNNNNNNNKIIEQNKIDEKELTQKQQQIILKYYQRYSTTISKYSNQINIAFKNESFSEPYTQSASFELSSLMKLIYFSLIDVNLKSELNEISKILQLLYDENISPTSIYLPLLLHYDSQKNFQLILQLLNQYLSQFRFDPIGYNLRSYFQLKYKNDEISDERDIDVSLYLNYHQQPEILLKKIFYLIKRKEFHIVSKLFEYLINDISICSHNYTTLNHEKLLLNSNIGKYSKLLNVSFLNYKSIQCQDILKYLHSIYLLLGKYNHINEIQQQLIQYDNHLSSFNIFNQIESNLRIGQWLSVLSIFNNNQNIENLEDISNKLNFMILKSIYYYSLGYYFNPHNSNSYLDNNNNNNLNISSSLDLLSTLHQIKLTLLFGDKQKFITHLKLLNQIKNNEDFSQLILSEQSLLDELYQSYCIWSSTLIYNESLSRILEQYSQHIICHNDDSNINLKRLNIEKLLKIELNELFISTSNSCNKSIQQFINIIKLLFPFIHFQQKAYNIPGYLPSIRHSISLILSILEFDSGLFSNNQNNNQNNNNNINNKFPSLSFCSNSKIIQNTTTYLQNSICSQQFTTNQSFPEFHSLLEISNTWFNLIDPSKIQYNVWKNLINESTTNTSSIFLNSNEKNELIIFSGDFINPEYLLYHEEILTTLKHLLLNDGYYIQPYHINLPYHRNLTKLQKKEILKLNTFNEIYELVNEDFEVILSNHYYNITSFKMFCQLDTINLKESLDITLTISSSIHQIKDIELIQELILSNYKQLHEKIQINNNNNNNNNNNSNHEIFTITSKILYYWFHLSPYTLFEQTEFFATSFLSSIIFRYCSETIILPKNFFHQLYIKSLLESNIDKFTRFLVDILDINHNSCQIIDFNLHYPIKDGLMSYQFDSFQLLKFMNKIIEDYSLNEFLSDMVSIGQLNLTEYYKTSKNLVESKTFNISKYLVNNLLDYEAGKSFINSYKNQGEKISSIKEKTIKNTKNSQPEIIRMNYEIKEAYLKYIEEENLKLDENINKEIDENIKEIEEEDYYEYEEDEEYYEEDEEYEDGEYDEYYDNENDYYEEDYDDEYDYEEDYEYDYYEEYEEYDEDEEYNYEDGEYYEDEDEDEYYDYDEYYEDDYEDDEEYEYEEDEDGYEEYDSYDQDEDYEDGEDDIEDYYEEDSEYYDYEEDEYEYYNEYEDEGDDVEDYYDDEYSNQDDQIEEYDYDDYGEYNYYDHEDEYNEEYEEYDDGEEEEEESEDYYYESEYDEE